MGIENQLEKKQMKEIQWIKKDEESLKKIEVAFLPKIGKSTSFGGFMKKVKTTQDVALKKKKRIKVGKRGKQKVIAAEWVVMELIDNINLRSKLSRRLRLARKQYKPEEILKAYKEEYEKQQRKTSIMSGKKKGEWEVRKIEETWKNGKKFWSMIKELLGNNKEKEEDTYVYTQEGEKKEIEEMSDDYINKWKQEIYQKTGRTDFSFWYGTESIKGKKEEMEEEEKTENSGIMKLPVRREGEMIYVIKKMKNGKAAGVDGVSAELM